MLTSMNAALLIPHFGYDEEYDLTDLVSLRYRLKKQVKQEHDLKLSYMPFIIKATSLALTQYPILNSQIESGNENLIYKVSLFYDDAVCGFITFFKCIVYLFKA